MDYWCCSMLLFQTIYGMFPKSRHATKEQNPVIPRLCLQVTFHGGPIAALSLLIYHKNTLYASLTTLSMAFATYSTFRVLRPAIETRPFLVM